jgi:hypothetical protein
VNSRRNFVSYLMGSILATIDEIRGIPQLKLCDLEKLPDERLAGLIPKIDHAGILLKEKEGEIVRKDAASMAQRRIDKLNAVEQAIFKRFSGTETIAEIAAWAADNHKMSAEEGFRVTRELFLRLSKLRICSPVNVV